MARVNVRAGQQGDREVQPDQQGKRGSAGRGAKARRAERRAAHTLARIQNTSSRRQTAWAQTGQPFVTERLTAELGDLYVDHRLEQTEGQS